MINDKAVSPVVGILLMVTLVIILAASIIGYMMLFQPTDSLKETANIILTHGK